MFKKSLIASILFSSLAFANPPAKMWTEAEVQAQLTQQKQASQKLEAQRQLFVKAEALLNTANSQNRLPEATEKLLGRMMSQLETYPLYGDLQALLTKVKSGLDKPKAGQTKLSPSEAQCQSFAQSFQELAEKLQPNPEAEQAGALPPTKSLEMDSLLDQFGLFWLNSNEVQVPEACQGIEAYWRDQGLKTEGLVKDKAVKLFTKSAKNLADLNDERIQAWLDEVKKLAKNPAYLQEFAQNQPLDGWNKALVEGAFSAFVRTLKEQDTNPDFSPYQAWISKFELGPKVERAWKIAYLNRLFDNENPQFIAWRDEQIGQLKADNLTERRIRMALWQKTDLQGWLDLLSDEAKNKLEWRYWLAKTHPTDKEKLLTALSQERGFYPMLAAQALGNPYQFKAPQVSASLDGLETKLAQIEEYRALKRFSTAKSKWIELVKAQGFERQVVLADYANQAGWFDLGVEATIQAKAWDYIDQRLPKAYLDWFALHLADTNIKQSFAMAIARQESAWNPLARSHANAMGLMQMLPTTAKETAQNSGLLYRGEQDLFEPFNNIMLGTAHLNELNAKYPNNRILVASAYNAGASRADRWLQRAGGRLAMDEFIASIPFLETRGYVQNVLAYDYYYQIILGEPAPVMFTPEELRTY
ncbi:hypothetical protein A4G20_06310 [Pasteurellaceae bacterium RH1A]|nr:hypothetical protein A4G20_06310 [Pasteurellaceae bacterium RH1A]